MGLNVSWSVTARRSLVTLERVNWCGFGGDPYLTGRSLGVIGTKTPPIEGENRYLNADF